MFACGHGRVAKRYADSSSGGVGPEALREIAMLVDLRGCPNIVRTDGIPVVDDQGGRAHLVMERARCSVEDLLEASRQSPRLLSPDLVRKLSRDLLSGLLQCHSRGIVHRDIKPQNLLLFSTGPVAAGPIDVDRVTLKLADFGLARSSSLWTRSSCGRPVTMEVATLPYRAPEVLDGVDRQDKTADGAAAARALYGSGVDVWSAGCVLVELALGRPGPPPGSHLVTSVTNEDVRASVREWLDATLVRLRAVDSDLRNLVEAMLRVSAAERVSAREALCHPYFRARGAEKTSIYSSCSC